ncbi:hypothetical protein ACFZBU_33470 [Embleya sp. NPDC008237]|uniref:hypothetical protein n=1 Tax=Embleya sp. NPDC008237 TaxID=3363978 RepID=UPI0036EFC061
MSTALLAWITTAGVVLTAIILGIKALLPHVRDLLDEVAKTLDKWREIRGRSGEQSAKQRTEDGQDDGRDLERSPGDGDVASGRVGGGVPDPPDRDDSPALKIAEPPNGDSLAGR